MFMYKTLCDFGSPTRICSEPHPTATTTATNSQRGCHHVGAVTACQTLTQTRLMGLPYMSTIRPLKPPTPGRFSAVRPGSPRRVVPGSVTPPHVLHNALTLNGPGTGAESAWLSPVQEAAVFVVLAKTMEHGTRSNPMWM